MTFNEFRGHFLTRDEAASVSHCSPDVLTAHPDVLFVGGFQPDGEVYPALQFGRDGSPTPGLGALARRLSPRMADAEIASFCTHPLRSLGGKSPIDWLRSGGTLDKAVSAAVAD